MSESFRVIQRMVVAEERGVDVGIAVIVDRQGSAPRTSGAMLMIDGNGTQTGSVGGGELERQVTLELARAMIDKRAVVRHFDLAPEGFGMPCGGRIKILMAPIRPQEIRRLFREVLHRLHQGIACRLRAEMIEPGKIRWSLDPDKPDVLSGFDIHLEPPAPLLVFGAGHIARALAPMAEAADFSVTVFDDRTERLEEMGDGTDISVVNLASFENCLADRRLSETDYILIATYAHQHDLTVLRQALKTPAGYIGMVGSRNKRDAIFARLQAEGMETSSLARVHCPVGLPIGAITPAEIAVSVLAEMIAHRRKSP